MKYFILLGVLLSGCGTPSNLAATPQAGYSAPQYPQQQCTYYQYGYRYMVNCNGYWYWL